MNFSTKNIVLKKARISPIMSFGIQKAMIVDMRTEEATTGSKRVIFELEGPAIEDENFKPLREGAKGQICTVRTIYLRTENQQNEFAAKMAELGEALGVRDQVDEIEASSLEEFVAAVFEVVKHKMARFVICTEQFIKQNGMTGNNLSFARFNWVENISVPDEESKLVFDKSKEYFFKPAIQPDMEEELQEKAESNDLPI